MKYTAYLHPNTYSEVAVNIDGNPTACPIDLLMVGDILTGFAYLKSSQLHFLDVNVLSVEKVVRPAVKIITPVSMQYAECSLVYAKPFTRTLSKLYADEFGYGSIEATEVNTFTNSSLRRRNVAFVRERDAVAEFFKIEIESEYEGFLVYCHHQYPILTSPIGDPEALAKLKTKT